LTNDIVVLGGGITGLTAGYLLNAPVVTSNVGGQSSCSFPLGPRYIHSTPETKEFISSLGLSIDERTVKVGYFYKGKYHTKIPKRLVAEYNMKTRGTSDTSSSIGRGSFKALSTSFNDVIDRLSGKVEVIIDYIKKISGNTLHGEKGDYKFRVLISTIPLPRLYELYSLHPPFRYISIGYCFSSFDESFFLAQTFGDFDYVYFPERKYPYYRITKTDEGFVYEFVYDEKLTYPDGMVWQEFGKILPPTFGPPADNVILLGRFGKWIDDYLFQDVLRDIKCILSEKAVHDVQAVH